MTLINNEHLNFCNSVKCEWNYNYFWLFYLQKTNISYKITAYEHEKSLLNAEIYKYYTTTACGPTLS